MSYVEAVVLGSPESTELYLFHDLNKNVKFAYSTRSFSSLPSGFTGALPSVGAITRGALRAFSPFDTDNVRFTMPPNTTDFISRALVYYSGDLLVSVYEFVEDTALGQSGFAALWFGRVRHFEYSLLGADCVAIPLLYQESKNRYGLISFTCWKDLYSSDCGLSMDLSASHEIISVDVPTQTIRFNKSGSGSFDVGEYAGGRVAFKFNSGSYNVFRQVIELSLVSANLYDVVVIGLNTIPSGALVSGEPIAIGVGCDRSWSRCGELNNRINFGGFPELPPELYGGG